MRLVRWHQPDTTNWDAFGRLTTLRDEINRLFEFPFSEGTRESDLFGWAPAVDLYEEKDNLVVKAELPGMKKEEIELSLHEGSLVIAGERKQEVSDGGSEVSRSERVYGRFQRMLELPKPVNANGVSATYKDGILTVTLPKTEESKPRQIEVKNL